MPKEWPSCRHWWTRNEILSDAIWLEWLCPDVERRPRKEAVGWGHLEDLSKPHCDRSLRSASSRLWGRNVRFECHRHAVGTFEWLAGHECRTTCNWRLHVRTPTIFRKDRHLRNQRHRLDKEKNDQNKNNLFKSCNRSITEPTCALSTDRRSGDEVHTSSSPQIPKTNGSILRTAHEHGPSPRVQRKNVTWQHNHFKSHRCQFAICLPECPEKDWNGMPVWQSVM